VSPHHHPHRIPNAQSDNDFRRAYVEIRRPRRHVVVGWLHAEGGRAFSLASIAEAANTTTRCPAVSPPFSMGALIQHFVVTSNVGAVEVGETSLWMYRALSCPALHFARRTRGGGGGGGGSFHIVVNFVAPLATLSCSTSRRHPATHRAVFCCGCLPSRRGGVSAGTRCS